MTTAIATPRFTASGNQRVFVGIDPSLTGTGVCVLFPGDKPLLRTIVTSPKTDPNIFRRIDHIISDIEDIIFDEYEVTVDDVICIEKPFVSPKNMNSQQYILALGYMIRRYLYMRHLPYRDVAPSSLKKFVTGKGIAEKSMMIFRVFKNWDISPDNDNEADAVGLAKIAEAINDVQSGSSADWTTYQLEVVRKVLAGD